MIVVISMRFLYLIIVSKAPPLWYSVKRTRQIENRHIPMKSQSNSTKWRSRSVLPDNPVIISNVDLNDRFLTHKLVEVHIAVGWRQQGNKLHKQEKRNRFELLSRECWAFFSLEYSQEKLWNSLRNFWHWWSLDTP